ncbi:MAG TPA: (Fe-S)-binding protein [Polyangiaceae bacterium]
MNPLLMGVLLAGLWGAFGVSAARRLALLKRGAPTAEPRTDRLGARLRAVIEFALLQKKMPNYPLAGVAHYFIFGGFALLLLRTLVLWGRGFDPAFNLWILGPDPVLGLPLGAAYGFLKDVLALLVISGALAFVYLRVVRREKRMTLSTEGLVILGIIITMMLADLTYDGASLVLNVRAGGECISRPDLCDAMRELVAPLARPHGTLGFDPAEPGGTLAALALRGLSSDALVWFARGGFWLHSSLVLIFLNILPYTKHFHIITAVPNVFLGELDAPGRLRPLAKTTEELMGLVEKASESEDMHAARIGYARLEHFNWKERLDWYTCTECGRCSDNCPAFITGKLLSPKQFTLDLRDRLYGHRPGPPDLVPEIIKPEVLWACTTCRACEEQCPVNITYVEKIVQMRRNLVTIRGEFPSELAKPFEGMETNGNPWNLARVDRTAWTEGLEVRHIKDKPDAEVLFWVGCAASYDDRAKKIARATARLLAAAGTDFAILAEEETCTGDPARRAGNEYVFSMLAETNAATLNGYKEQGGIRRIVTTCPHCFNTLAREYPDFGAKFEVVHHSDFLLGLVAERKLAPKQAVNGRVAYHDSCYLGRYNENYESPRAVLASIPGVELVEVEHWNKKRGLCCGAGGAQMWMEEQNKDRVNVKRTLQLLDTGAKTIASACPFCMTMLTDGIKSQSKEQEVRNLDIAELLAEACGLGEGAPKAEPAAAE